ncbi:hypothetical protein ACP6M9_14295, partial [Corynebacterium striatum]
IVFIEGHSITFELFGVPRHGGRLPFFPTQPGWISGVYQTGVRPVADITYVRTLSGFAYTAFVVDVFSRKIVGVATRSTMRTDALPMEALEHALTTAGRIHGNQLIHHSDR